MATSSTIDATPHQLAVIAIVPKFTAAISILMSSLVVATILRDKLRCRKLYHRLVLGLSVSDIIGSFSMLLTTWLIPKDTDYEIAFNSGNDTTCRLHAFTSQLVIATPLYNTSLTLYFLFRIKYGWNENTLRRWEPFFHGIPWVWGIATATLTTSLEIHGVADPLSCWIDSKYIMYQWVFMYGPVNLCVVMVAVISLIIYRHVRTIEQRSQRYAFPQEHKEEEPQQDEAEADDQEQRQKSESEEGDVENGSSSGHLALRRSIQEALAYPPSGTSSGTSHAQHRSRSKIVAGQCFWFAGAFFLNWFPISVRIHCAARGVVRSVFLLIPICTPRSAFLWIP